MDLPALRHFKEGIIYSDPVQALVGEAWATAVLCYADGIGHYWATPDLARLSPVTEWRYATQAGKIAGCDLGEYPARNQGGQAAKASTGNRVRKSRKEPKG
jgi:hypothetical protein